MGPEERAAAAAANDTFVRPAKFYLSGFSNVPHAKYYYVFLCLVYVVTVLGNGLLLSTICLVRTLHTARYMIVFNLALADLCGSTALIPKALDVFLSERRHVAYAPCLSDMFFVSFFFAVQSWTLVTMAYDRLVAICFPLRYHRVVTAPLVGALLLFVWAALLGVVAAAVGLVDRLSFCDSLVVQSFFCDHGPVYRLSCGDSSANNVMAYVAFVLFVVAPLVLIVLTYVAISVALSRVASGDERLKALRTCTSHLIIVAIFFLPILGNNIAAVVSVVHPNARIVNSSLTQTVPALLNPIVYSLKTEEVLASIRRLFRRNRLSNVTSAKV